AEAFEVALARDRLAKLGDLRDVREHAERAARAARARRVNRRDRHAEPARAPRGRRRRYLLAPVRLARSQTTLDQTDQLRRAREQGPEVFFLACAVEAEYRARGRVDDGRAPLGIEGEKAGREARHDALAELLCGRRSRGCTRAQALKLALLRAELRDDLLKSFQNELGLIARALARRRVNGRALRFVNELPVWTQKPARQKQNARHADDERDDEDREQNRRALRPRRRSQSDQRQREQVRKEQ